MFTKPSPVGKHAMYKACFFRQPVAYQRQTRSAILFKQLSCSELILGREVLRDLELCIRGKWRERHKGNPLLCLPPAWHAELKLQWHWAIRGS